MSNATANGQSSNNNNNNQSFGQNASDIVSLVALIISLAAFATTVLQVLQQYLASADGYRRCAPSVIGPWSRMFFHFNLTWNKG
jgi:type IV secretory pathway VirB6-like protein